MIRPVTVGRMVWITILWIALWGEVSIPNAVGGVVVAVVLVVLFETWRADTLVLRPLRALRFGLFFAYKLVESTLVVARTVIAPRDRVKQGIVAVPLPECSDAVATIVAGAITLTPGTITVEVRRDPLTLYVHALDTRDVEAVRLDVRKLEWLAVRAFGDRDAVDAMVEDDDQVWRAR